LAFSRFRSTNEYLYSHNSGDAVSYMSRQMFQDYHKAYTEIATKWPQKPIDVVQELLEKRFEGQKSGLTLVDMGCGDVPQIKRRFPEATVHSFDLVALDPDVTEADMSSVPLEKHGCDAVVFCLSLMGTNLRDYLLEANRILKTRGHLIVAEVASRFEELGVEQFSKQLEEFGFKPFQKVEHLPPNGYFLLFDCIKFSNCKKAKEYPDIQLKPCLFKPR
jgi:SAM-dependent methyltransferase